MTENRSHPAPRFNPIYVASAVIAVLLGGVLAVPIALTIVILLWYVL